MVTAGLASCGSVDVKFYEKEHLASPLMSFSESPTETSFVASFIRAALRAFKRRHQHTAKTKARRRR